VSFHGFFHCIVQLSFDIHEMIILEGNGGVGNLNAYRMASCPDAQGTRKAGFLGYFL
jgi:hypothetical protein